MAVAALPGVGVRLLVDAEVAKVEGRLVGSGQFLVLPEVAFEMPGLRLRRRPVQSQLHQPVRRQEILVQQKTRSHQGPSDVVHVPAGLLLGEFLGQTQRVQSPAKQGFQGDLVFPFGEASHHGASAAAGEQSSRVVNALPQLPDNLKAFLLGGLVRLLGRHLLERDLIDDLLRGDQVHGRLQRQAETFELALALLHFAVVAFKTVAVEEPADIGGHCRRR